MFFYFPSYCIHFVFKQFNTFGYTLSNQIRKTLLHPSKLGHPPPQEQDCHRQAQIKTRPVYHTIRPQDTPTKTIDHPHHGVNTVQQAPLSGHYTGAESYG